MSAKNAKDFYHERLVPDELPWYHKQMYYDHIERYKFASSHVKKKRVLDVACGSGYGAQLLAKGGALSVIGLDASKEAIKYANNKYPHRAVKYLVGNATHLPFKKNSIDVVVSFETLEHVRKYELFIKEIQRVLRKDGVVIISTPNKILGTESANPFHIKEFNLSEFETLMKKYFYDEELFGQKPVHMGYLSVVNKITAKFSPGKLRWFVDTCFKLVFRGSKVIELRKFRRGFTPSYFISVAKNSPTHKG